MIIIVCWWTGRVIQTYKLHIWMQQTWIKHFVIDKCHQTWNISRRSFWFDFVLKSLTTQNFGQMPQKTETAGSIVNVSTHYHRQWQCLNTCLSCWRGQCFTLRGLNKIEANNKRTLVAKRRKNVCWGLMSSSLPVFFFKYSSPY